MKENFITKSIDEDTQKIKDYVSKILVLENEIKGRKDDIKFVKQEAKEDGILTKEINKALGILKSKMKVNEADKFIIDKFVDMLEKDDDILQAVANLMEK